MAGRRRRALPTKFGGRLVASWWFGHQCWWVSLEFLGALNSEFLEAAAKRIRVEVERPGCPSSPLDDPPAPFEDAQDVVALNLFET